MGLNVLEHIQRVAYVDTEKIKKQRDSCDHVSNIERWDEKLNKINIKKLPLENLQSQFESLHFELDVIANICKLNPNAEVSYEPRPLNKNGKNCDLIVEIEKSSYLVECKHFSPESKTRAVEEKYFPKNFVVDLDEETFYHDFTIRGKLLSLIGKVESKISNYKESHINVLAVSTGFYIDWPRLMYVACLYSMKQFHPFDYLAKLTNHYMRENSISFKGCINEFWSCHKKYGFVDELSTINTSKGRQEPLSF